MNKPVVARPMGKAQTTQIINEPEPLRASAPSPKHDDKPPVTLGQTPPTQSGVVVATPETRQPTAPPSNAAVLDLKQPRYTWSLAQSPACKLRAGHTTANASLAVAAHALPHFKDRSER